MPPHNLSVHPVLVHVATAAQLTAAVAGARPGEEILVAPGEYRVNLVAKGDGPVVVRGQGRVVLSALDPTLRVVEIDHASHWRLEGLAIRGSRHADVRITGGSDVTLSRCEVYDAGKKGIIANGDRILIDQCWIHDIAQPVGGEDTQGIVTWGATRLVVMRSRIETPGDGILIGGAQEISRTSSNIMILFNHFHADDAWYGRLHTENAIDVKNVSGLLIAGNVFHHYHGRDDDDPMGCAINVVTRDPEVAGRIEDVRLYGNVFYDVVRAATIQAADGPGRRLTFAGNLVTDVREAYAVARKPPAGLLVGRWDGLTVVGNVFAVVDGAAVRLYEPVRDVRFKENVLLASPGLVFRP
jgi:parallel beta helix pectate lyase-like protein